MHRASCDHKSLPSLPALPPSCEIHLSGPAGAYVLATARRCALALGIDDHRHYLQRAIDLASEAFRFYQGGPFGAVVVRDGQILGEGGNAVLANKDPTSHAEIVAIRAACSAVQSFELRGATIYSSGEPCPMCLGAIYWARIERIYYAATRDDAARAGFDDALFYEELARPPAERRVSMVHVPMETATSLFDAWNTLADKVPY